MRTIRTPMRGNPFSTSLPANTKRRPMSRSWLWAVLALFAGGCLDAGESGNLVPRTVTEDPSLPQIEVAGTHLHAEAFGNPNAPMVMVLHGGPGVDYRSLLPLQALASEGYRVIFWDQRGTGLSQRHEASTYSMRLYLEDLRQVIEHYTTSPNQPLVFIGHSWGAMYATWFVNEYGDYGGRVRGAILSEPGAFTKQQLDAFLKKYIGSVGLTSEQLNDATWSAQFMSAADHARADYLSAVLSFGGAPAEHHDPRHPTPFWRPGAVVSAKMLTIAQDDGFDWTTHLAGFQHKVLFLRGSLNDAATLEQQQELARSYPDADVLTMANAGHEMVWEHPEEYLGHTRDYFQQIGFTAVTP